MPHTRADKESIAMTTDTPTTEESIATIAAMRGQEDKGYKCQSDLYKSQPLTFFGKSQEAPVDATCRSKMAEWCFQVIDFCDFNRETCCISMNYLDRFLATPSGAGAREDRKIFQLVSMVCLYTAIKIHEPQAMEPSVVSSLSRGTYSEEEITAMERTILSALGWQMNPPTALSFVYQYLSLIPEDMISESEKSGIMDLSKFQTELAVSDIWFQGVNPSTIALASLTNAMNVTQLSGSNIDIFVTTVIQAADMQCNNDELLDIEDRLFGGLEKSSATPLNDRSSKKTITKDHASTKGSVLGSPRSVSASTST
mmetsp:Transcript_31073/g.51332  ORF Transcript_31073/g.51332 Transcript_31073/m.51332 type:complete len:312 (-) Transcript_31073:114-1049(-)|eukprot:CAMPEP_0119003972 /NCGR_PEP_ID=MMETSP1176-20130426/873_1 /TAXON_ID=265551 /ORGANISM="Synedropsis recta cf, Strain CCMP1620" /LENGTH=311 /DNA_ID=CAMNT_0006955623 /DNA_START=40 /DNA_END=975 /DNA_ORIENTATION=+